MKLVMYNGRPKDEMGRLDQEKRTYDMLEDLQIEFERVDHDPAMTIDACGEVEEVLQMTICKNLFLCNTQKTCFCLLVMPGRKKFLTKLVSKQLGIARLSFAPEEYMKQFLDITPGSVSIMGLMNDHDHRVRLLVDREVLQDEYFACHPCINTSSLKMKTQDVFEKLLKAVGHEATVLDLNES